MHIPAAASALKSLRRFRAVPCLSIAPQTCRRACPAGVAFLPSSDHQNTARNKALHLLQSPAPARGCRSICHALATATQHGEHRRGIEHNRIRHCSQVAGAAWRWSSWPTRRRPTQVRPRCAQHFRGLPCDCKPWGCSSSRGACGMTDHTAERRCRPGAAAARSFPRSAHQSVSSAELGALSSWPSTTLGCCRAN